LKPRELTVPIVFTVTKQIKIFNIVSVFGIYVNKVKKTLLKTL